MAHSATWDKTAPSNSDKSGLGADNMRTLKRDAEERMQLDHHWTSSLDITVETADGYHKKATLKSSTAPASMSDAGIIYAKDVSAKSQLHYKNNDGVETKITEGGKLNIYDNIKSPSLCRVESGAITFDLLNEINLTTKKFTPVNAGRYLFKLGTSSISIEVYGSSVLPDSLTIYGVMIKALAAGDYVKFMTAPSDIEIMRIL